jgi:hypothetical protein
MERFHERRRIQNFSTQQRHLYGEDTATAAAVLIQTCERSEADAQVLALSGARRNPSVNGTMPSFDYTLGAIWSRDVLDPVAVALLAIGKTCGGLATLLNDTPTLKVQQPAEHQYVGPRVTKDNHVRHEPLPSGRCIKARGRKEKASRDVTDSKVITSETRTTPASPSTAAL